MVTSKESRNHIYWKLLAATMPVGHFSMGFFTLQFLGGAIPSLEIKEAQIPGL